MLSDPGRRISVALVDSGFSFMPSYAKMHGARGASSSEHGDRILSIFSALDRAHPLSGLELHLSCYNPSSGYDGLARAISILPDADILSISLSWRDDSRRIAELLKRKFGMACVPSARNGMEYPGEYDFCTSCSDSDDGNADWCIRPNPEWNGNSYAVPAIARLMCYGVRISDLLSDDGTPVEDVFSDCRNKPSMKNMYGKAGKQVCNHCGRHVRDPKTHGFMVMDAGTPCPYCGFPLQ